MEEVGWEHNHEGRRKLFKFLRTSRNQSVTMQGRNQRKYIPTNSSGRLSFDP